MLEAGIRQCPNVELWCDNSPQYMKWIFSRPLLHSVCGKAVVGYEFNCCYHIHKFSAFIEPQFIDAHLTIGQTWCCEDSRRKYETVCTYITR